MIRITNGAIDIVTINGVDTLALRGVIDPMSLKEVRVPAYQREVLSTSKIESLKKAIKNSRVPDIDLGMRGSSMREIVDEDTGKTVYVLEDDTYVIDGLQRKTAGEQLVNEDFMPHLGVIVHFDTNEVWERERFEALNIGQTGLSNNVTLRNLAESNTGAATMLEITKNSKFILFDKVSWTQNMRRGDLITAITFYKTVGRLHSHLGPGKGDPRNLARTGIAKIIGRAYKGNFVNNVIVFFWLLEECFGISNVAYRKTATHLKTTFLVALAGVLSDHEDFWEGNRLTVPADLRRKLAKFPVMDPTIRDLASSSGMAVKNLEIIIADHINSGKRTKRLRLRATAETLEASTDSTDSERGIA